MLTLRLDPVEGAFDDAPLRALCDAHEVLGLHQHLLHIDGEPALALIVTHRPLRRPGDLGAPPRGAPAPVSAAEAEREVPEADRSLYAALRRWRNERAEREGKPAFVLFRNSQLVELARMRPRSLADLRRVHGVGDAKTRDYGAELLALIATAEAGHPAPAPSPPGAASSTGSADG